MKTKNKKERKPFSVKIKVLFIPFAYVDRIPTQAYLEIDNITV